MLLAFEPPDGGVAEQVAQLAGGLGEHGFAVTLAGPADATAYAIARERGIEVLPLPWARGYGAPRRDAATLRALIALLRRGRFDLVHAHSAKAGVLVRLAAPLARVPAVYSPHSFPFVGEFGAPRRVVATAVERALGRLGAPVICVCEAEREVALRARVARPDRLRVVLNGCPPAGDVPADEAVSGFAAGHPVAGVVTVLRPQKSVDVYLRAAVDVLRRRPEARMVVVGEGPEGDRLRALARELGLDREPRFAFLPFRSPAARALRALDVYVLSSSWEALPIGVLEALACGTPQVATDVGGTGEAVSPETGVLVAPHDHGRLAAAIVELLDDPGRRERMAAASVARHAERFTVERMVAQTAEVYREVLGA